MKWNRIVQHVPAFVDAEPQRAEFDTLDELLAVPWVAQWQDPKTTGHQFCRFCISEELLIVEADEGRWWWVVGRLSHPERVQLPPWRGPL
jgi:hypothetical protein